MKRKLWGMLMWLLAIVLACCAAYGGYVYFGYQRQTDERILSVDNAQQAVLPTGKSLSIMTLDTGFGAFTRDYSYFMAGGRLAKAAGEGSVYACLNGILDEIVAQDPGIILLQQVDTASDRAAGVDEHAFFRDSLADFASVYALNWKPPYLLWPLQDILGRAESGMLTLSRYQIEECKRISLPVPDGAARLFDLDRCYEVIRMPVDNGRCLSLFNVQLSPWLEDDDVRKKQMTQLANALRTARENGDYVIAGGSFAHDLLGGESPQLFGLNWQDKTWCQPLKEEMLGEGFLTCAPANAPTCRDVKAAYEPGKTYIAVTDGFIVSEDVTMVDVMTDDTDFAFSHHQPVLMKFRLTE